MQHPETGSWAAEGMTWSGRETITAHRAARTREDPRGRSTDPGAHCCETNREPGRGVWPAGCALARQEPTDGGGSLSPPSLAEQTV